MKKNLIIVLIITLMLISLSIYLLNRDNHINDDLNVEIPPVSQKTAELVTLYFPDKGRQYLVRENRVIEHTTEQRERLILEELIRGPVNKRNTSVIPSNVEIMSIVSKGETVLVYLSREFKSNMGLGSNNEILAVYSIVNSLTELKTIKNVQLIIESEEYSILQKHMPLDHVYRQNLSIVNNPIKNPIEVVKEYFFYLEEENYRRAFDLIYEPSNLGLDYSMYYNYQKNRKIEMYNIYTYKMIDEEDIKVVTFKYSEIDAFGNETYYDDKEYKLKNYYGEWKIILEDI